MSFCLFYILRFFNEMLYFYILVQELNSIDRTDPNIQTFPNNEDITKCDTNMIRLCNFFCGKPTKNKISNVE